MDPTAPTSPAGSAGLLAPALTGSGTGLGMGARALSHPLARPATWRVLDVLVGTVMLTVALRLAL